MKTVAIVAAAGKGVRIGFKKQYYPLDGKPLLVHSLECLQGVPDVNDIILALPAEDMTWVRQTLLPAYQIRIEKVVAGGESRQETIARCLEAIQEQRMAPDIVLIHDGARPNITPELVTAVIKGAYSKGAVVPGLPLKDTVKVVDQKNMVLDTPPRDSLVAIQTPQGFRTEVLYKAYRRAEEEGWQGTDDASLVERAGHPVYVIPGGAGNLKVTTGDDLDLLENPKSSPQMRTGFGLDIHPLVAGVPLILGGIKIPSSVGCQAHSDGDVFLHALMDAMLGAAGMTDIGTHFPPGDEQYKGISSLILTQRVDKMILAAGWRVNNMDAVIALERPRLSPHIVAMKERIASTLNVNQNRIGIKATTAEKLGFVGREEGIMAQVVVTLTQKKGMINK